MQVIVLMGVSGAGKTTVGKLLSTETGLPFFDADDFHPLENVRKMESGIALMDEDRLSWLEVLALKIREWENTSGAILACSALKETYRDHLQAYAKRKITWVFLHADYEVILDRLNLRKNHYFKPELLRTQYEALQIPKYGFHINVEVPVNQVVENILEKLRKPRAFSEIGLLGLGVMGKSLALNMAEKGVKVSVYNRQVEETEVDIARNFSEENSGPFAIPWFDELEPFVQSLQSPKSIFLMVNAGKAVDVVIEGLLPFLEPGDLIIDGGNSHYTDTVRREKELSQRKILFMGVGISGGEEGARKGPSIMPGGPKPSYERAGGILEKIAAKDRDGNPCCSYIGPDGAGHFVKMLHNGIEYGEMQLIAEFYHYLRFYVHKSPHFIAEFFEDWNRLMKSYLLEISVAVLKKKENEEHLIDKILDAAGQKGTGGWSTNAALELGVPFDTITAAVMARNISARKEDRMAAEKLYGIERGTSSANSSPEELFKAYRLGSMMNHAIGFDLLLEASKAYEWDLNLSEIARIWTNGCIIRSAFMEDLIKLLKINPSENLLLNKEIVSKISVDRPILLQVLAEALQAGSPMPVLSAGVNYLLAFTSGQSSANMIQAQRDFFGAHTYERTDEPRGKFFHTNWLSKD